MESLSKRWTLAGIKPQNEPSAYLLIDLLNLSELIPPLTPINDL